MSGDLLDSVEWHVFHEARSSKIIDQLVACDGINPGRERLVRIVGMPSYMKRQQRLLNEILHISRTASRSLGQRRVARFSRSPCSSKIIDQLVACDGINPGRERLVRIVGMPSYMKRQQRLLNEILHISCKNWYSISRTVLDNHAHCGNADDCSVRAFAVKPRAFGAPLCGVGARPLSATEQRGHHAANACRTMLPSIEDTRSSDNVRQVECWFPQMKFCEIYRFIMSSSESSRIGKTLQSPYGVSRLSDPDYGKLFGLSLAAVFIVILVLNAMTLSVL